MSMPLCVGLVDDSIQAKVLDNLVDSINANNKALTAGDVGFHYLVEALTNGGKSQLLYEMNARNDVPGYGYQLKKGATALTESWPALANVSNNHLMLGHLMEWFYTGLGGINQDDCSSGYKDIVIKPEIKVDIHSASTSYQSPYGQIKCEWKKQKNGNIINIDIPVNSSAKVILPAGIKASVTVESIPIENHPEVHVLKREEGQLVCSIGSGKYSFKINE
jgi:hypothetical protein